MVNRECDKRLKLLLLLFTCSVTHSYILETYSENILYAKDCDRHWGHLVRGSHFLQQFAVLQVSMRTSHLTLEIFAPTSHSMPFTSYTGGRIIKHHVAWHIFSILGRPSLDLYILLCSYSHFSLSFSSS